MGRPLGWINQADAVFDGKSEEEIQKMVDSTFHDMGRQVCVQIMERVFGLKFAEFGGEADGRKEEPTPEPQSTVH